MAKRPPHILVTTPESLYILLTSRAAARLADDAHRDRRRDPRDRRATSAARTWRCRSKRLEALDRRRRLQRVGLSATQKPLERGRPRSWSARAAMRARRRGAPSAQLDLAVEIPPTPLATVCSHEQWDEIYDADGGAGRRAPHHAGVRQHPQHGRAGRGRAAKRLGEDPVASHHGSLSRERGSTPSSGSRTASLRAWSRHGVAGARASTSATSTSWSRSARRARSRPCSSASAGRATRSRVTPKGRLFPLTPDELVEARRWSAASAAATSTARRCRRARSTSSPSRSWPTCVAEAAARGRSCSTLVPPRVALPRARADGVRRGRRAAHGRGPSAAAAPGRRRPAAPSGRGAPRLPALRRAARSPTPATTACCSSPRRPASARSTRTSRSKARPATSSSSATRRGGSCASRPGRVRVSDAQGPAVEHPVLARRGAGPHARALAAAAARRLRRRRARRATPPGSRVVRETGRALGERPRADRRVRSARTRGARRAADAGADRAGALLRRGRRHAAGRARAVRAPRSTARGASRCARSSAAGSASNCRRRPTRRRSSSRFGPQHSFPLESVFDFLHPASAREVLIQALLAAPMFGARWRWNVHALAGAGARPERQAGPAPL